MRNYIVFVINLKKDTDRLIFIDKQLKELGIEYERIDAIDGKEFMEKNRSEYDKNLAVKIIGRELSLGEIGCALSHKRCYQKFFEINKRNPEIKYCLILEDDLLIDNKNFKHILEECISKNEKKQRWNYLQFSYPAQELNPIKKFFTMFKFNLKKFQSSMGFANKIRNLFLLFFGSFISSFIALKYFLDFRQSGVCKYTHSAFDLASCYMIDKNSAEVFIKETEKIKATADGLCQYIFKKYKLKFRFFTPRLVHPAEHFDSTIDKIESRDSFITNF